MDEYLKYVEEGIKWNNKSKGIDGEKKRNINSQNDWAYEKFLGIHAC